MAVDLAADGVGNVVAQTLAGFFTSAAQAADQSAEYAGIGIGCFFFSGFLRFFLLFGGICGFFFSGSLAVCFGQCFKSGVVIHHVFVGWIQIVVLEQTVALFCSKRGQGGLRRQNEGAFYRLGHTFFIKEGNEGFADAEFGNRFGNFDIRIAAECFGSSFDCFLVTRCEGAQGVLYAVTQLAENGIG